jgi:hypothetical protein
MRSDPAVRYHHGADAAATHSGWRDPIPKRAESTPDTNGRSAVPDMPTAATQPTAPVSSQRGMLLRYARRQTLAARTTGGNLPRAEPHNHGVHWAWAAVSRRWGAHMERQDPPRKRPMTDTAIPFSISEGTAHTVACKLQSRTSDTMM